MKTDLGKPLSVPFENIALDPNNPRVAPEDRPGYEKPDRIFASAVQQALTTRVEEVYDVQQLEHAVITQGWTPIDAILVWEHHKKKGHYVVVEGNTRTVVLRRIRTRLPKETEKLKRMQSKAKQYAKKELEDQRRLVEDLKQIVEDTKELRVVPVIAASPDELEKKLPRLLGVRHVTSAMHWKPYATNLYMLSLYEKLFEERFPGQELALKSELIDIVGGLVSTNATKTRRNIQAASAFSHLKARFEDRLSDGDSFGPDDQYYLENILANRYAQDKFQFGKDDLTLSPEMEDVLFKWAFRYPRGDAEESKNVFRKAEDIRRWAQMKRYDDQNATNFASRLDVEKPDEAESMSTLELAFLERQRSTSPIDVIRSLVDKLGKLEAEKLLAQASHLRPLLDRIVTQSQSFINAIDANVGRKAPP
jgi:hypothetical protein